MEAPDTSEGNELFASFASGVPEQEAAKPTSFITSKAGMGVIGGAIAAAALTVYLLTAHSASKQSAAVKAPATPPVQVSSTAAPTAPASDGKTSDGKTPAIAANQHMTAGTPVTAPLPGAKPATTSVGQSAAQQIPAGYSQQSSLAQRKLRFHSRPLPKHHAPRRVPLPLPRPRGRPTALWSMRLRRSPSIMQRLQEWLCRHASHPCLRLRLQPRRGAGLPRRSHGN